MSMKDTRPAPTHYEQTTFITSSGSIMDFLTNNTFINFLGIGIALMVAIIAFLKWKLSYWEREGFPTLNPVLPFGDTKPLISGKATFGEQFEIFYKDIKAKKLPHAGIYLGITPFYVPADPEIIKHILQTDFQHFVNHGVFIDEENDPLSGHLFNLEDTKWKNMRAKLIPTFTSGKMKMMFETLADCALDLDLVMDEAATNGTPIDGKDVLGRFSTDVIGSVAFGLECNSLKNPDSPFRKYGKKVFDDNPWDRIKALLQFILPRSVLKIVKFKMTKTEVEDFFMKIIRETVNYREENNIYRKDFMHLLIQLKNRGKLADDEKITEERSRSVEDDNLTFNELSAQAFVFFVAGFESSSTTMGFALFELATNPNIQDKLRNEINKVLSKYKNKLTYEAVMEMTYLEQVIYETLRKYPPVAILVRKCTKDYTIPKTGLKIKKDINVSIPVLGLHRDPELYPDPDVFDPERFSEENIKSRPLLTWLSFGEGPRICIGMRFGMLQIKVGLITLLRNYRITLNSKTQVPIAFDKFCLILTAKGGIWLNVEKIHL